MTGLIAILSTKGFWTVAATLASILAAIFWYFWDKKRKSKEAETERLEEFAKKKIEDTKSIQKEQPRINDAIDRESAAADKHEFSDDAWGGKRE